MELNELLVDPTGVQTWRLGESELLISTTELSQHICELEALRLRMVTDLDTRATAKTLGASNTAAWLSGATRMSPGAASGMVHLGRALTELSATAEGGRAYQHCARQGGDGILRAPSRRCAGRRASAL